jgi:oligosaccharide reducing-end xylanase
MRIRTFALASIVPFAVIACTLAQETGTPTPHATPNPAIDGQGAFATGKYRNLFAEAGHPQAEIDAKLDNAFQQLFHGDQNTQTLCYDGAKNDNGPTAYIVDFNNRDVRTEGMSYGMMIAVQMNKKAEFDALWNWANTYMYYTDPNSPNYGYFAWTAPPNTTRHATTGPAPDGEEYFAMALYFAAHRWPGGKGIYDYKAYADKILTEMLHRTPAPGSTQPASQPTGRGGRGGGARTNMFEPNYKMVRFTPGATFTDPSYHLPHYYELFARWGPEADRDFWLAAATASRDLFAKVAHKETGLCPDQCSFDGVPSRGNSGAFQADAWRCQSNIAVDWSWFAKDPREQELSNKVQATFAAKGMDTYPEKMSLDAKTVISPRHVIGLVATNAAASLAATAPRAKDFTEALYNAPIPDGQDRYYSGCLYLMNYMHCSGKFRIW